MNSSEWIAAFSFGPAVNLASYEGANLVLIGVSVLLSKVWAARSLARETAELNKSLEATKADFVRSIEQEKANTSVALEQLKSRLQELSTSNLDALTRKREIYSKLATKMRILVASGVPADKTEEGKQEFLTGYDVGYLWASEDVVVSIGNLITCLEAKLAITQTNDSNSEATKRMLNERAHQLYRNCLLQMRKDCGFPNSGAEFRLVVFK